MFTALKNWLANAASSIATKYALRASVAVPFLFAAGFAIAAVTVFAVEAFGSREGYLVMAAGFAGLGVLGAVVVWWREKDEEREDASTDIAPIARTATQVAAAVPAALTGKSHTSTMSNWILWPLAAVSVLRNTIALFLSILQRLASVPYAGVQILPQSP